MVYNTLIHVSCMPFPHVNIYSGPIASKELDCFSCKTQKAVYIKESSFDWSFIVDRMCIFRIIESSETWQQMSDLAAVLVSVDGIMVLYCDCVMNVNQ